MATTNSLQFKYGLASKLQDTTLVPINNGTVYFTTDERCMYVDMGNARKRIQGSVIYYETLADFTKNTKPPYNTDTLYFIRVWGDKVVNALMAYNGTDWVQINVTAEDFATLETNFNALQTSVTNLTTAHNTLAGRVTTAEGEIDGLQTLTTEQGQKIATNTANIATNTTNIATNTKDISDNKKNIATNTDNIGKLNTSLNGVITRVNTAESDIDSLEGRMNTAESDIDNLQTTTGEHTSQIAALQTKDTQHESAISALQQNQSLLATKEALNQAANQIGERIGQAETAIEKNADDIADLKDAIGSGTSGTSLSGRVSALEGRADGFDTKFSAQDTTNNSLQSGINTNKNDISDLKGRMTTAEGDIDKLEGRMATAESDIDSLEGRMATAESTITTHGTDIQGLQSQVQTIVSSMATDEELEAAVAKLNTDLSKELTDHINSANAMRFKGVISDITELPTSGVAIGDTWVVKDSVAGSGIAAGDFYIAEGTETNGIITSGLTWHHVVSGYDASLENKLVVGSAAANSATVGLQSYGGTSLGGFTVTTDNANIQVGLDTSTKTITISSAWVEF